jgi:hypothetical protein
MQGLALIAAERFRQINEEGYDAAHDDRHKMGELAMAAIAYACPFSIDTQTDETHSLVVMGQEGYVEPVYPFAERPLSLFCGVRSELQPKTRINQLAIAGALIAAEIDRISRTQG